MASSECCRLCKGNVETVVSVFDKRINENLPAIVQVTTGVEITQKDEISQKLCLTCLQITIKMFKFRKTALKNNEELMTKHAQSRLAVESNKSTPSAVQNSPVNKKNSQHKSSFRIQPKYKNAHPSIKIMLKKNPGIVLPPFPLNSHVQPYITLDHDEVEEYYSDKGISPKEIEDQKKSAIKAAKSAQESPPRMKRSHDNDSDEQHSKRICLPAVLPETKKLSKNVTLVRINPQSAIVKATQELKNISNGSVKEPASKESPKNGSIFASVTPTFGQPSVVKPSPSFSTPNVVAKKKTLPSKPVGAETNKSLKGSFPPPAVSRKEKGEDICRTLDENDSEKFAANDRMPRLFRRSSTAEQHVNHVDTDHAYAHSDAASSDSKRYKLRLQKNVIYDDEEQSDSSSTLDTNYAQENDDVSSESSATSRSTISLLDSSLVSHSHKKPRTLFSCKVCDCVLYSKKDLHNHLQRTHTKCPFCSNRFRTTTARDEHVANECTAKEVNNEPIKLKNPKLELVRVDDIKEIRDKYPLAFTPEVADIGNVVSAADDATETTNISTKSTSNDVPTEVSCDIICISDEETDKNSTTTTTTTTTNSTPRKESATPKVKPNVPVVLDPKPKINIVNSNILEKINMQDSDSSILRLILKDVIKSIEKPQNKPPPSVELPKNSSIEEGDTSRIQILRNLRTHLSLYRIPVDIQYGEKLKLEYSYSKVTGIKQKRDFWYNLPPKDIKKITKPPNPPSASSNTVIATPFRPNIPIKPNNPAILQGMLQSNSSTQGVNSNVQAVKSNMQGVNSNMQGVNSNMQGVNSNMQGVNSNMQGVTSNMQVVTSNIQGVNSNMQIVTSNIQGVNSNIQGVNSNIQGVNSNIQGVTSNIQGINLNLQGGNSHLQGVRNSSEASGSLNTTNAVYTIHNVSQSNTLQPPGNLFLTVQSPINSSSVQNTSTSNPTSSANVLLNVVPTTMNHLPVTQSSNISNRTQNVSTSNPSSSANVVLNVLPSMNHLPVAQSSNVRNRAPVILNAAPQKHMVTQYCSNEPSFVIASIQGGVPAQNTPPTQVVKPASNNIFLVTPTTTTNAPSSNSSGQAYLVMNKNVPKLNNTTQTRAQVYNPLSSAVLTPLSTGSSQDTFTIVQSSANSSPAVSEVQSSAPSQPVIRVKNIQDLY